MRIDVVLLLASVGIVEATQWPSFIQPRMVALPLPELYEHPGHLLKLPTIPSPAAPPTVSV